jgi:hypothetical protein
MSGTLEYQACDASTCYLPRRVPLSSRVEVRQLDTARPNVSEQSP